VNTLSRVFPYDKSIMLSVLYDTLDALGFNIEQANSERGTIIIISAGTPNRRMRIACNSILTQRKTTIQIFPEIMDETGEHLSRVLLDELSATIKRNMELATISECNSE
jgi:hypothetical protein